MAGNPIKRHGIRIVQKIHRGNLHKKRAKPLTMQEIRDRDGPLPRIRWLEACAGMTQQEFADYLGTTYSTYRQWCHKDQYPPNPIARRQMMRVVAQPHPSRIYVLSESDKTVHEALRALSIANNDIGVCMEAMPRISEFVWHTLLHNRELFESEINELRQVFQGKQRQEKRKQCQATVIPPPT